MKLKINKMTLIDILEQNIKELNLSNNKLSSGYHRTAIFIHLSSVVPNPLIHMSNLMITINSNRNYDVPTRHGHNLAISLTATCIKPQ